VTAFAVLSKESVKSLGAGAYLVSVLPAAVLIVSLFALVSSRLYPWMDERESDGQKVARGLPSVVSTVTSLGVSGVVLLAVAVLVTAILASPFQIAMVQLLEGRWTARFLTLPEMLAIELHRRRRSVALWAAKPEAYGLDPASDPIASFNEVAVFARQYSRSLRHMDRARSRLDSYPRSQAEVRPTMLGNILNRAETTAGERYGLNTVRSYPRLYPHVSDRLATQLSNELHALDASAALTLVLTVLAVASAPLLHWRNGWMAVPAVLVTGAVIAYRGAKRAAALYADLLCTAYDLHRFAMLEAMHRALPDDPKCELLLNKELSEFLVDAGDPQMLPRLTHKYAHPQPTSPWPLVTDSMARNDKTENDKAEDGKTENGKAMDVTKPGGDDDGSGGGGPADADPSPEP
jgi:hypothetical protein